MNSKKTLSLILASVLTLSCMTACGEKTNDNGSNDKAETTTTAKDSVKEPEENKLPIANGDVTLSIYTNIPDGAVAVYKSLDEHPVFKVIERQTGLKFTYVTPPQGDDGTFFNTTIASGVIPDIIRNTSFSSYPGGPQAAIDDGVLADITDLVSQYGYYFKKAMASYDENIYKNMLSDDGRLIRWGSMLQCPFLDGRVNYGLFARKDIIDKYKLETPKTFDQYEAYFDACLKEGMNEPLGFMPVNDGNWTNFNYFASAYGVTVNGFILDDNNKVVYSRTLPQYKEFLTKMNEWYKKGYITSDFLSNKQPDVQKRFKAGSTGMTVGWCTNIQALDQVGKASNPAFETVGVPYPRLNENDKIKFTTQMASASSQGAYFVSATCEHQKEAVKFIDYLYKPETVVLCAWGPGPDDVEGDEVAAYTVDASGKKTPATFLTDGKVADFTTMQDRYRFGNMGVIYDDDAQKSQYEPYPEKMSTWAAWAENTSSDGLLPKMITPTLDESKELSSVMTTINTYSDEIISKFITGEEPLENFDKFVEQVNSMGIDKAIKIEQSATDRYNAR